MEEEEVDGPAAVCGTEEEAETGGSVEEEEVGGPAAVCGKEEEAETGGSVEEEEVGGPAAVSGKEEEAETGGSVEEEEADGVVCILLHFHGAWHATSHKVSASQKQIETASSESSYISSERPSEEITKVHGYQSLAIDEPSSYSHSTSSRDPLLMLRVEGALNPGTDGYEWRGFRQSADLEFHSAMAASTCKRGKAVKLYHA